MEMERVPCMEHEGGSSILESSVETITNARALALSCKLKDQCRYPHPGFEFNPLAQSRSGLCGHGGTQTPDPTACEFLPFGFLKFENLKYPRSHVPCIIEPTCLSLWNLTPLRELSTDYPPMNPERAMCFTDAGPGH